VAIGGRENAGSMWGGMLDDVRIYNRALTASEISVVMTGDPNLARDPVPANGSAPDVEHTTSLSWTRGVNAAQHDVYFGTDAGAVQNATPSEPMGVYMGSRARLATGVSMRSMISIPRARGKAVSGALQWPIILLWMTLKPMTTPIIGYTMYGQTTS
jgi:hypothetical protein